MTASQQSIYYCEYLLDYGNPFYLFIGNSPGPGPARSGQKFIWPKSPSNHTSLATARSDLVGPVAGKSHVPYRDRHSAHPQDLLLGADYTYRDSFDLVSTVTAPCGASTVLNIVSDLRTSNSANTKGSGYIATDSVRSVLNCCRSEKCCVADS